MKTFNLERALAGDKVVCRDASIEVLRVLYIPELDDSSPVSAVLKFSDGMIEMHSFPDTGSYYPDVLTDGSASDFDLFMAPTKRTVWVTLLESEEHGLYMGPLLHQTAVQAVHASRILPAAVKVVGHFPLEIEE